MKSLTFFKLLGIWIIFVPIFYGCSDANEACLPYEGEIYDFGNPCSGIVIKVTNRDVNSIWSISNSDNTVTIVDNVIGIRADPATIPIDSSMMGEKFYFNFRELLPEEIYACPTFWNAPSRILYVTDFSFTKCPITED